MQLQARMRERWAAIAALVRRVVVGGWHRNTRLGPRRHAMRPGRSDAMRSPWIEAQLRTVKAALAANDVAGDFAEAAHMVDAQKARETQRLATVAFRDDPHIGPMLDGFRDDGLARIKSLDEDAIDDLRELLEEAEAGGWRVEDLADEIEERLGVASSKAEQLARTSTLQFGARITKERQTSAGISRFAWSTSEDERVRPSHEELDEQVFSWDDLPEVDDEEDVYPGLQPNCRCVPLPILDEDAAEEDDEEPGEEDATEDVYDEPLAAE